MFVTHSYAWSFWVLLWCCCLVLNEGRTVIIIDSSSAEGDSPPSNNRKPCCADGTKNQDETDVDCGGSKCRKCENMRSCKSDCDCISDICRNNTCVPPETCTDRIKNQDETDVDCGGNACPKCYNTRTCMTYSDCISNFCNRNRVCSVGCVPTCKNGGMCISDNNCSCPTGYNGPTCEIQSFGLCLNNDTSGAKPILLVTFGKGSAQFSNATPAQFNFSTTYKQQMGFSINDGEFSFVNSIENLNPAWHLNAKDHTGDEGGYMYLVNADFQPGQFYSGGVNHLCVGLRYEFSVYLANLCKDPTAIDPNVRFEVRTVDGKKLLAQLDSGNIPESTQTMTWQKYGLSFTATESSINLLMISNAPGGRGNDLVIDDIALRVCSNAGTGFCPPN